MQNQSHTDLNVLILTCDEHLGANLRVLLASLPQTTFRTVVKTASSFNAVLHHGIDAVFVDAQELHGNKGKGLADCVNAESALVVIARSGQDAVLAFELEATDCIPLPLLGSRIKTALEKIRHLSY